MSPTTATALVFIVVSCCVRVHAFFSFGRTGTEFPKLYEGWFDGQLATQVPAAVAKAYAAGIVSAVQYSKAYLIVSGIADFLFIEKD
jgi:hypothetical protein